MQWSNALWLLAIQPVVKACVELHTTMQFNFYTADTMSMQVWYNGRLVCQGSGEVGQFARDTTTFSLRNSDGKGSGCEEGFGAEITNYGRSGTFYNYSKTYGVSKMERSLLTTDLIRNGHFFTTRRAPNS